MKIMDPKTGQFIETDPGSQAQDVLSLIDREMNFRDQTGRTRDWPDFSELELYELRDFWRTIARRWR